MMEVWKGTPHDWKVISGVTNSDYFLLPRTIVIVVWILAAMLTIVATPEMTLIGCGTCYVVYTHVNSVDYHIGYKWQRVKIIFIASFLVSPIDLWCAFTLLLWCGLYFVYLDEMVLWFASSKYDVIRLTNGVVLPMKYQTSVRGRQIDPRLSKTNDCGWKAIFEDPELAKKRLNIRHDGRMDEKLIKKLVDDGFLKVWFEDEWYISEPNRDNVEVVITGVHMLPWSSTGVAGNSNAVTVNWICPEAVGVVLPEARVARTDISADRTQMVEAVNELYKFAKLEDETGRMAECALISALQELDIMNILMTKTPMDQLSNNEIRRQYLSEDKWYVYNYKEKTWVGRESSSFSEEEPVTGRRTAWDGYRFVNTEWKNRSLYCYNDAGKKVNPRYLLYISKMPYRRGLAYVKRFSTLVNSHHQCEVWLEEGVPSCGKTTNICTRAKANDLITLPGREGAKEYLAQGKDAKTIDSIVVNGWSGGMTHTLWVDEGLLTHPGAIEMAIQMVKPVECRVFGDRRQIPFYPRVNEFVMDHSNYPWSGEPVIHNIAYRNPKVICDKLRPLYPNGYVWGNDIVGSIESTRISSTEAVPVGFSVYLTFTQGEKTTIKLQRPTATVMTIHEAQGLRFEKVALVRLRLSDLDIYDSLPHLIVAMSRAWRDFHYYTVRPNDKMDKWIGSGTGEKAEPPKETKVVKDNTYKYKGGAFTPLNYVLKTIDDFRNLEGYKEWMNKLEHLMPKRGGKSTAFFLPQAFQPKHWIKSVPPMPSVDQLQIQIDDLYHRRNPDVIYEDRLDWPIKWPDGGVINLGRMRMNPQLEPRPALKPKLITPQAPRGQEHDLDEAMAFGRRIVNPARQKIDYAPERSAKLVDGFMKNVNDEIRKDLNVALPCDCEKLKAAWWATRNNRKKLAILASDPIKANPMTYYAELKKDHKTQLDDGHIDGVPAGQLVTAHATFYTSFFAPFFNGVLLKIIGSLKENIIVNTLMSWEELDARIDNLLSGKTFQNFELDISKYDKSQEGTFLDAQCQLLELFGVDHEIAEIWRQFHEYCKIKSSKGGVSYVVGFQRRSGDSLTWSGNTIVLIMILAYLYDLEKAYMVLVGGDDNSGCWPTDIVLKDESKRAAEELNFELKVLHINDSMYFSSRFIILTRFGWMTVADPVKLIARLGRNDLQGREHLKAIHDSWKALHYAYMDYEVRQEVEAAAVSRYRRVLTKNITDLGIFVDAVAAIVDDYNHLEKLYFGTKEEWNLKLDPNERVGGGLYQSKAPVLLEY
jgi:hypothetical protein